MYFQSKKIRERIPILPEAKCPSGSSQTGNQARGTLKMITIGESTIAGVGVETHEEGVTGSLARELSNKLGLNVDWKVYAHSGYTVKNVTEKILPQITEKEIDLIVVGMGGNDAFSLNSPWKWKMQIQRFIEKVRSRFPLAIIIFGNMPPIKEFPAFTPVMKYTIGNLVELFGRVLEDVVDKYDKVYYVGEVISIALWTEKFSLNASKSDFFSDGVHPSKLTYQLWAKDMAMRIDSDSEIRNALLQDRPKA